MQIQNIRIKQQITLLACIYCLIVSTATFAQSTSAIDADAEAQQSAAFEKQLRDTISLWGGAWAAQIPEAYFGYYTEYYIAPGFDSREAWMADRRSRIVSPEYIRIRLLDFELVEISELLVGQHIATTRFTLIYERPGYSDRTYKELELLNTGEGWKITSEENLRVERDNP